MRPLALALALALPLGHVSGPSQEPECGWPPAHAARAVRMVLAQAEQRSDLQPAASALRRWFDGCDATAARNAAQLLRRVIENDRKDELARLVLGVALARGPEVQVPGASGYLHRLTYHYSNSEREARRELLAVAREAGSAEAALELTALALATRHRASLEEAATSLRAALRQRSDPELSVALAEVLLASGDIQGARQAATRALNVGDRRGQRALAIALMRSNGRADEAGNLYLARLETADRATVALYFEDITPLLTPAQVAAWERLPDADKGLWIRREWEWRASTSGVTTGERIAEHQRRLAIASDQYQRTANRGPRPEGALGLGIEPTTSPFDDRGLVFIRHGPPAEVIRGPSGNAGMIREAWAYPGLGTGRALFEFAKPPGYGDWVLAAPLRCDPFLYMFGKGGLGGEVLFEAWVRSGGGGPAASAGTGYPTRRSSRGPPVSNVPATQAPAADWRRRFEAVYLDYTTSLGRYDPTLAVRGLRCLSVAGALEQAGPTDLRNVLAEISFLNDLSQLDEQVTVRAVEAALVTETGPRLFTRPLRVLLSLYEFLRDGTPELTAFAGIPGSDVVPHARGADFDYGLRLSLALEDDHTRTTERMDTSLDFRMTRALVADDLVRAAITVPFRTAGPRTIRVAIGDVNDRSRGQIVAAPKTLGIPAGLALSDLVIAETRDGTWARGRERLAPIPGHQVVAGAAFRLFYELYGAHAGTPSRVRIVVAPGETQGILARVAALLSKRSALSLSFEEVSVPDNDGVARMSREIAADLRPGRYSLQLTIQNLATGETATRSTDLLVVERTGT